MPLLRKTCLIVCFISCSLYGSVKEEIAKIPSQDRWVLESFFRLLLMKEAGAYVLFGDKPVAITAYPDSNGKEVTSCFCKKFSKENKLLRKGWETWKRYRDHFPSTKFLLECREDSREWHEIVLINRREFVKMADTKLLASFEKGDQALFDLLQQNHERLGILLGFGRRNARSFSQSFGREVKLKPAFREVSSKTFRFLYLPHFFSHPDSNETIALQKKYRQQRHQIQEIYAQGDFLEITLQAFSGGLASHEPFGF